MAIVANARTASRQTMSHSANKPWLAQPMMRPVNHVLVIAAGNAGTKRYKRNLGEGDVYDAHLLFLYLYIEDA